MAALPPSTCRSRSSLTVPEIFTYSSNIGTARMGVSLGVEHHKRFLRKMGQLDRLCTELPESAEPLVPTTKGLTSFTAVLPADRPRYMLLIMLDEPQALPETHGFTTSGWNAVPVGGAVISRIAPLLGIEPRWDLGPSDKLIVASAGGR
jgi:cell division protein FtsI/penicillin-binding protein 2